MSFTTMDKGRPGVWINFTEAANALVEGADGVVAIVKRNYNVTATVGAVYEFSRPFEARQVVGVTKMQDVAQAFEGGAAKVIVYIQPADAVDYADARSALELQFFEALTFDHALSPEGVEEWKSWMTEQEENDVRHELFYGVADDEDIAAGIARSRINKSETVTNVINAPKIGDTALASFEIAPFVAGAWAAKPLNSSITYEEIPNATDVNVRLTAPQIKEALQAGAIVFEYTGRNVRIVRGVTTAGTSLKRFALKQTISRDWKYLVENKYIGKVQNGSNPRLSMKADLSDYLGVLEAQGVIEEGSWFVNVGQGPEPQQVIITASLIDVESMEEVYINIGLGA